MNNQWDDDEVSGSHVVQGHDPGLLPDPSGVWGLILLAVATVGFLFWLFWSRAQ